MPRLEGECRGNANYMNVYLIQAYTLHELLMFGAARRPRGPPMPDGAPERNTDYLFSHRRQRSRAPHSFDKRMQASAETARSSPAVRSNQVQCARNTCRRRRKRSLATTDFHKLASCWLTTDHLV